MFDRISHFGIVVEDIDRATALKLAGEGARILASDLDAAGLQSLREELQAAGSECHPLPGDVTELSFGDRAVAECLHHFGDLHIVVNNAGYIWNSRIVNHTD